MSTARISKMHFELNNNSDLFETPFKRNRNESLVSVSSASSCHSDSSEDVEGLSRKSSTAQELTQKDNVVENADFKRLRSMSDGFAHRLPNQQEPFEVFPSLPDSVLEKMGLLGTAPRERLNEDELEQKFVSLSLAFTIDAATIKDRCERQRRYRDQTETNLNKEIERLIEKANRMQTLCIDAETTELLSALLGQIDIMMKASSHATISAERYGAVQHENRISDSVHVMINHVNLLKQQRDSARRQLQYTKRVLQNSNSSETTPAQKQISPTTPNGRIITKRRASIATISRPVEITKNTDTRKITRRTSDLSLRASSLARNSRPNRLELGVDLVKIKEGMVEEPVPNEPEHNSDHESIQNEDISSPEDNLSVEIETAPPNLRQRITRRIKRMQRNFEDSYDKWTEDGTIHEICCFCALMCFSISIIILANILIEVEVSKRGLASNNFFWYLSGSHTNPQNPKRIYHGGISTT